MKPKQRACKSVCYALFFLACKGHGILNYSCASTPDIVTNQSEDLAMKEGMPAGILLFGSSDVYSLTMVLSLCIG